MEAHQHPTADGTAAQPGPPRTSAVVLFVDDDAEVLAGLRRALHVARPRWRTVFATQGEQALDILASRPVDVLVSDMRMPGMSGADLLTVVRERHPGVARLILSGYADLDSVIAALGPSQQFLCKPIETPALVTALERLLSLQAVIADPQLRELLGAVTFVPKQADVCRRLAQFAAGPRMSLDAVADLMCSDVTMSAEVLRLVNSSSFVGLSGHVGSVHQAVRMLGEPTLRALIAAGEALAPGTGFPPDLDPEDLSARARRVASAASRVAEAEGWPPSAVADLATAGLLHHIGLPVLAAALPERWAGCGRPATDDPATEHRYYAERLGCSLTQASAYLLGLWGFPETTVHALADQPAEPGTPGATAAGLLLSYVRHASDPGWAPIGEDFLDPTRLQRWRECVYAA